MQNGHAHRRVFASSFLCESRYRLKKLPQDNGLNFEAKTFVEPRGLTTKKKKKSNLIWEVEGLHESRGRWVAKFS